MKVKLVSILMGGILLLAGSLVSCSSVQNSDGSLSDDSFTGKTVLRYVVDIRISESDQDAMNRYLIEQGADYIVSFESCLSRSPEESYSQLFRERVKQGDIDIAYLEQPVLGQMLREDKILMLDEYLKTAEGKNLYTALPADNWYGTTYGDSVWGINGIATNDFRSPPCYAINRALMEKHGLTVEDFQKPIYEMEDVLKKIYDEEQERISQNTDTAKFAPGAVHRAYVMVPLGYQKLNQGNAVFLDEKTGKAMSVLDIPEYVQTLKAYWDYIQKGYMVLDEDMNTHLFNVSENTLPPMESYSFGRYEEEYIQQPLSGYDSYSMPAWRGTAILKDSPHQEEALDFLTRVYTDPHLTNLLVYGSGYENDLDEQGRIKQNTRSDANSVNIYTFGNQYLSAPMFYDYPDKTEKYLDFHAGVKKSAFTGFVWDSSQVEEEFEATSQIVFNKYYNELFDENKYTDIDTFLSDLRKDLDEAGIQKVLDDVNAQLDAFRNR